MSLLRMKIIFHPSFKRLMFLFCGLHISICVNLYLIFARQSVGRKASIHHCVHSCSAAVIEMDKIVKKARTCQMLSYLPASKLRYLHLCSLCSVLAGGAQYLSHWLGCRMASFCWFLLMFTEKGPNPADHCCCSVTFKLGSGSFHHISDI